MENGKTEYTHGENVVESVAAKGQAATDSRGQALVTFDPVAESKLRTKIDLFIIPTVALLYLFCFIDRANIGNARIAGLEADLGMSGYDYNAVISIFYISYILFEIPSNLVCKWMGPGWFLPLTTVLFGAISLATAYVNNFQQAAGVRFALGVFEAGMLPGVAYYLSRWYCRAELAFRLALYLVMAPLAGAFGGLLASAILTLDNFAGLHSWRMIFAIEGIITICLGAIGFLTLTDRPETAKWLTAEERELCIARVKAERVGTTEYLDKIDMSKFKRGIFNPVTLSTALVFLLNNITVQGLAFFLPTIVRTIYPDFTTVQQQLRTVPPWALGAFFTLLFPLISWRLDKRQILMALSAPMVIVGYAMFLGSSDQIVRYAAMFLVASSCMALGPLTNAQVSANVVSDTARSGAIGTNVMFGNIGGLVAAWSFTPNDGPNFPIGNGLNLGGAAVIFIVTTTMLWWMKRDNAKRDARDPDAELAGLTDKQIEDLDWKHPGFRWNP
ncbi:major facilitator superfamily domain-containing protein [Stachybotrys elegans]|uniref:Major facilitator superfamily domain-containing protein n=1 Tax=Stachybotrys elegans TaxID=80388 RepID=A0A8K0WNP4_9HYPO|nr:major facilitator superfamily domain-containing protein [Stachybotrys elegans]